MVFFTCSQCGQAVKKNQVEKHCSYQCRNCQSLSCIDCGKEFWGDEYKEHSKCISEDQKYGGKNYVPKANANKGELKQEKWIEQIKNTIASKNLTGPLSNLLNTIIEYPNIPRKQAKFKNFLVNSLRICNPNLISQTWEIFAESTKNESNTPSKQSPLTNGSNGMKVAEKRPASSFEESDHKRLCTESTKNLKINGDFFDWSAACEKILMNHPNGIHEKLLRKQVISQYKESIGEDCNLSKTELKKQFRDLLSNNSTFTLFKNNSNES